MRLFPSRWSYGLIASIGLIDGIWLALSPVGLAPAQLLLPATGILSALLALHLARRALHGNAANPGLLTALDPLLQGIVFLQLAWVCLRVFNHVSMSSGFPYADGLLMAADAYLPLRWMDYFEFFQARPVLLWVLERSYTSLDMLSLAAFLILAARSDRLRMAYFLEAFLTVATLCTAVGLFLPAKAAVAVNFPGVEVFANFSSPPGLYHLSHLERLRAGGLHMLELGNLPGLVTFPSLHTAAGIILAVSFWRTGLFAVAAAYCAIMILSTPIFGGHYFVDLFAGAALAAVVLRLLAASPRYAGLFRGASRQPRSRKLLTA
ncbi:phosphatase PAP2 family protein [Rhizobium sp. LjRoot30]|uniref:phosphatase PAP2 family protein n=1 Tax=Rhizobium sp. LjRoot30 TaxID=3342320 RepID=UPI003ECD2052